MRFHLNYSPKSSVFKISHRDGIYLIGSCFSENIGAELTSLKFNTRLNPDGILFNPLSILDSLRSTIHTTPFNENHMIERDGLFLSYRHHSSIWAKNKEELATKINSETKASSAFLKEAGFLIISFGTAFTYFHKDLAISVANCHKQNTSCFDKNLTEVGDIVECYSQLIDELKTFNPKLKIIFTVSPVKHLRDGVEQNSISKSTLLLSISKIIGNHTNCFYFPAFELVNDDLRDYRFYAEDLAHPNKQAVDYIWMKFSECYFDQSTQELNKLIRNLNQALHHRPIHETKSEMHKLKEYVDARKTEIKRLFPGIEF